MEYLFPLPFRVIFKAWEQEEVILTYEFGLSIPFEILNIIFYFLYAMPDRGRA